MFAITTLTLIVLILFFLISRFLKADADISLLLKEKIGKQISSLRGKVVWITGASSGIGEHLAYELARCGAKLILSSTNAENLEKVKKKCTSFHALTEEDILVLAFDIADFETFPKHIEKAINTFGKVDILVNNAGRSQRAAFESIDYQVDKSMFDINVLGSVVLTRLLIPHFHKQGHGHVVVTSSVAGKQAFPGSATYSGTKFALHGYFECLRAEQESNNIKVTFICPGPVFSNILEKAFTGKNEEKLQGKMHPGEKRMATERCAYLSALAIANEVDEAWVAVQPVLLFVYIGQYLPTIYRRFILRYFLNPERVSKLREGKR